MKTIVKTLLACGLISLLGACGSKETTPDKTAANSSNSDPSVANSPDSVKTSTSSTAKATKINASLKEMTINLSSATALAGEVEFVVKNDGKMPHEFVVLKNELLDKNLPVKGDKLDEDAKGLKKIEEINEDKLKSGQTQTIKVNLTPGRYLIVCNIGNHFKKGMKTEFIVK